MRGARTLETALWMLAGVCVAACDAAPDLPDRHTRRFIPFNSDWIPESEIPEEPQESPNMVIWEFTETLATPGPAERKAAQEWLARCYESAQRNGWHDYAKGLAEGWENMSRDPYHYRNREHMLDDRVLDSDRPEFLMYYPKPDGTHGLAGFMFIAKTVDDRGPQFAGRLSIWHRHIWALGRPQCVERGVIALDFAKRDGTCERGEPRHESPEMLHTWLIDHPKGPFATSMILPPEALVAGLEKRQRERGF